MNYPNTQLYIDGHWRAGSTGATLPVTNPATGVVIGTVSSATTTDLEDALSAAERGFDIWRRTPARERARIMYTVAGLLRERIEAIATLMTLEQGKPLTESRLETLVAADVVEWFAGEAMRAYGRVIPPRSTFVSQNVLREPVGVVAAFSPWNFPINQLVRKISAALAAGCSIIAKGPEETPASPAALVQAFADGGVPPGVIALVFGDPAQMSTHLIAHPVVRKITFTGSTAVGKQLAAQAGAHMKRMTMELGGHAPVLVCEDADISNAARILAAGKFRNAGQVCISPTRFLVHERVYAQFVEEFSVVARALRVGDGLDETTGMGPLANRRRVDAMERLLADALARGARLVTGGTQIDRAGYFFTPTVIGEVPVEAQVMNEEPFGPIAPILPFSDLDAAIKEANRLPVGLAAYAFTRSLASAHRISNGLESGMISINHAGLALPETPNGGLKESGYGAEGGSEAIESYLVTKFVTQMNV
ncbi:NAD-dependent succinate-semialdehyde dehydrogenase [Paraburkholderia sp. BCC1885]|uniref:NAD-dependent succinate-semialdehyde dehydrogenase n=1 Tax=Paraburkholderia sp. BCC1885 TaxID=2562669 RepID=UPI0011845FDA|nr:NAD-dependent succinate-semialdehyde dehydrogenase [Paraburkholderia sp. BCC1885]